MAPKCSRLASAIATNLERALAALGVGAGDEALEQLVVAWGKGRVPRLSGLIRALSERLEVAPVEGSTDQRRAYLSWCERATPRRVVDVGPLVAAFLEAQRNPRALAHLRTGRLKLLSTFEPDPRIDALCDALSVGGWEGGRSLAFERVAHRHADPDRPHPGLAARIAKVAPREGLEDELASLLAALEAALPTARLRAVSAATPATPGAESPEALLAAVYADPSSDALKQILADGLAGHSDPRGEFIALQFQRAAGTLTPAAEEREHALLKRHLVTWLGPLAPHVVKASASFEKGFPATLEANARRIFEAREALGLAEWATVRQVRFLKTSYFGRAMRSLREATGVEDFGLRTLMDLDALPPLVTLALQPSSLLTRGRAADWAWLPTLKRLETLEVLMVELPVENAAPAAEVIDAVCANLPRSTWRLCVTRLALGGGGDMPAVVRRACPQLRTVELNGTEWLRTAEGWAWR